MCQQDKTPGAPKKVVASSVPEFYFPVGGGADPDFNIPTRREPQGGRFFRWLRALAVLGR